MPGEIETAHNFQRDIFRDVSRPLLGGVECDDANRVVVLAGHQVANDSFEIGFADIDLGKCGARFPVIVDDKIKCLIVAARHNRRDKAPAYKNSKRNGYRENLNTKPRRRNRSRLPPTALAMISGERFGAGFGMGALAVSASVIVATRTMSEIGVPVHVADMSELT